MIIPLHKPQNYRVMSLTPPNRPEKAGSCSQAVTIRMDEAKDQQIIIVEATICCEMKEDEK